MRYTRVSNRQGKSDPFPILVLQKIGKNCPPLAHGRPLRIRNCHKSTLLLNNEMKRIMEENLYFDMHLYLSNGPGAANEDQLQNIGC